LTVVDLCGQATAIKPPRISVLRLFGVTIRKTVDIVIATRYINDSYALLYSDSDSDFDPFVEYLGLRSAMTLFSRGAKFALSIDNASQMQYPVIRFRGWENSANGLLGFRLLKGKNEQ
jgi:hypothetical protein